MWNHRRSIRNLLALAAVALTFGVSLAMLHAAPQAKPPAPSPGKPTIVPPGGKPKATPTPSPAILPAPDYLIGPDDVLTIQFWRDKDVSGDVVVRPDGKISLPLLNDIQAAGLTPEQLRLSLVEARKFFEEDPTIFVQVKQINSRKVFITGEVVRPGPYPLGDPMTVLQLISKAGGLTAYADKKHIVVVRENRPGGPPLMFKVNYNDFWNPKKLKQNIDLKIGDTVIVK